MTLNDALNVVLDFSYLMGLDVPYESLTDVCMKIWFVSS